MKNKNTLLVIFSCAAIVLATESFSQGPVQVLEKAGSGNETVRDKTGYFGGDIFDIIEEGKKGHVEEASRTFEGDVFDLIMKGNVLYVEEKFDEAEKVYKKAHEGSESSLVTNFNIGCVHYKKAEYDAAQGYFHAAYMTADMETKRRILFNVGNSFFKQNDYPRAMKAYIETLKLDPGNKAAKHNLEMCIIETQQVPQMEERLTADEMPTQETNPGTHTNTVSDPEENLKIGKKNQTQMDVASAVGGTTESLIQFNSQYKDMAPGEIEKVLSQVEKEDIALLKEIWRSRLVFSDNTTKDW